MNQWQHIYQYHICILFFFLPFAYVFFFHFLNFIAYLLIFKQNNFQFFGFGNLPRTMHTSFLFRLLYLEIYIILSRNMTLFRLGQLRCSDLIIVFFYFFLKHMYHLKQKQAITTSIKSQHWLQNNTNILALIGTNCNWIKLSQGIVQFEYSRK